VKVTVQTGPDTQFKRTFNPFKFVVILDNLIDNSRKAGAKNVRVTIDVLNEKTMELHFVDDGVGIPDKDIDRIFDFGFSTTGGSGIGLYHIKKILSGLGSIVVDNHLEKGVEFIVRVEK
jgi:signal transduction histidine kinase